MLSRYGWCQTRTSTWFDEVRGTSISVCAQGGREDPSEGYTSRDNTSGSEHNAADPPLDSKTNILEVQLQVSRLVEKTMCALSWQVCWTGTRHGLTTFMSLVLS